MDGDVADEGKEVPASGEAPRDEARRNGSEANGAAIVNLVVGNATFSTHRLEVDSIMFPVFSDVVVAVVLEQSSSEQSSERSGPSGCGTGGARREHHDGLQKQERETVAATMRDAWGTSARQMTSHFSQV